jgi:hypothetical protein
MCLTLTYNRVRVGKNLPDIFLTRNGLKQADALLPLASYIALEQGFSKGVPRHTSVPRNFWTVPREKVLGKCEHIKKVCVLNI